VKSVSLTSKEHDDVGGLSPAMTSHMICCLDMLNANYDGLGGAAAQYAAKFQLLAHLHATLTTPFLDQRASCCLLHNCNENDGNSNK